MNNKHFILITLIISLMMLCACTADVEDKAYTLEFNDKSYEGLFTGLMEDGVPNGEGKFVSGEKQSDDYLIYEGSWEAGTPKGEGKLSTNNYVVHFPKTDENEEFDRIGEYEGDTIDGIANGQGAFKAVNGYGEEYTYNGEWKDGLWDGYGVMAYTNNERYSEIGDFVNGSYMPNIADLITSLGTQKENCPYSLSEDSYNFIKEHEELFLQHKKSKIKKLTKDSFDLGKFKKNPADYEPGFVEISSLYVLQAMESSFGGYDLTFELSVDQDGNYYWLYTFGHSDNVVEGAELETIFMPLGYSTYESVSGDTPWAISGVVVY